MPAHGRTLYERWFNSPFDGPIIPFGADVHVYLIYEKKQGRVHQFGTTVLPGISMDYALNAGESLLGDLFLADAKDFANDATI